MQDKIQELQEKRPMLSARERAIITERFKESLARDLAVLAEESERQFPPALDDGYQKRFDRYQTIEAAAALAFLGFLAYVFLS